ncbi:hypothetical protein DFH27DRAFT_652419 [Peziza echinospora]|nr:hypothetical protein DFH27DRAFT_652419 [Peziza echinospora]
MVSHSPPSAHINLQIDAHPTASPIPPLESQANDISIMGLSRCRGSLESEDLKGADMRKAPEAVSEPCKEIVCNPKEEEEKYSAVGLGMRGGSAPLGDNGLEDDVIGETEIIRYIHDLEPVNVHVREVQGLEPEELLPRSPQVMGNPDLSPQRNQSPALHMSTTTHSSRASRPRITHGHPRRSTISTIPHSPPMVNITIPNTPRGQMVREVFQSLDHGNEQAGIPMANSSHARTEAYRPRFNFRNVSRLSDQDLGAILRSQMTDQELIALFCLEMDGLRLGNILQERLWGLGYPDLLPPANVQTWQFGGDRHTLSVILPLTPAAITLNNSLRMGAVQGVAHFLSNDREQEPLIAMYGTGRAIVRLPNVATAPPSLHWEDGDENRRVESIVQMAPHHYTPNVEPKSCDDRPAVSEPESDPRIVLRGCFNSSLPDEITWRRPNMSRREEAREEMRREQIESGVVSQATYPASRVSAMAGDADGDFPSADTAAPHEPSASVEATGLRHAPATTAMVHASTQTQDIQRDQHLLLGSNSIELVDTMQIEDNRDILEGTIQHGVGSTDTERSRTAIDHWDFSDSDGEDFEGYDASTQYDGGGDGAYLDRAHYGGDDWSHDHVGRTSSDIGISEILDRAMTIVEDERAQEQRRDGTGSGAAALTTAGRSRVRSLIYEPPVIVDGPGFGGLDGAGAGAGYVSGSRLDLEMPVSLPVLFQDSVGFPGASATLAMDTPRASGTRGIPSLRTESGMPQGSGLPSAMGMRHQLENNRPAANFDRSMYMPAAGGEENMMLFRRPEFQWYADGHGGSRLEVFGCSDFRGEWMFR